MRASTRITIALIFYVGLIITLLLVGRPSEASQQLNPANPYFDPLTEVYGPSVPLKAMPETTTTKGWYGDLYIDLKTDKTLRTKGYVGDQYIDIKTKEKPNGRLYRTRQE